MGPAAAIFRETNQQGYRGERTNESGSLSTECATFREFGGGQMSVCVCEPVGYGRIPPFDAR